MNAPSNGWQPSIQPDISSDETRYHPTACIPQQTDIHDFFLSLKREKDNQTINQPSLLYHGIHDIVKIREGKEIIVWIDLKQITNHMQVIVHNLNDKKKHIIYIEDNNGKYDSFLGSMLMMKKLLIFPPTQIHQTPHLLS